MFAQKEARENDQLIADLTKENEELHTQLAEQSQDFHRLRKKYDDQKQVIKEYESNLIEVQKKNALLKSDLKESREEQEEEKQKVESLTS